MNLTVLLKKLFNNRHNNAQNQVINIINTDKYIVYKYPSSSGYENYENYNNYNNYDYSLDNYDYSSENYENSYYQVKEFNYITNQNENDIPELTATIFHEPSAPPKYDSICSKENDIRLVSISSDEDDFENEDNLCSICLSNFNEMKTIKLTECHHCFHYKCIKEWLKDNDRCPLCNSNQNKLKKRLSI